MRQRLLGTWNAKLVTFVGGTCGSVSARALSQNLKELQVLCCKYDTIRTGLLYHKTTSWNSQSIRPSTNIELESLSLPISRAHVGADHARVKVREPHPKAILWLAMTYDRGMMQVTCDFDP